jgi:Ca2+-binding RTX toxin-like protein
MNWFSKSKKQSKVSSVSVSLSQLEDRCVPAAFVFNNGELTINMSEIKTRNVSIGASRGDLLVNGRVAGGTGNYVEGAVNGKPDLISITSIVVNGSNQKDTINLSKVDTQFNNLDGKVTIYGNSGNDNIQGSQFADTIFSGNDNDIVSGLGGNDKIYGEGGNDNLFGDGNSGFWDRFGGDDFIDGGIGNDYICGSGGNDTLVGGWWK